MNRKCCRDKCLALRWMREVPQVKRKPASQKITAHGTMASVDVLNQIGKTGLEPHTWCPLKKPAAAAKADSKDGPVGAAVGIAGKGLWSVLCRYTHHAASPNIT